MSVLAAQSLIDDSSCVPHSEYMQCIRKGANLANKHCNKKKVKES
jgi:hypothetical protein